MRKDKRGAKEDPDRGKISYLPPLSAKRMERRWDVVLFVGGVT